MTLPTPDEIALQHSEKLTQLIRDEITQAGGQISFARYMELALYAPGLGYYSAGMHKFGRLGDFVTAPEISPLFARCVARQCAQVIAEYGTCDMLEIGAGSGIFARDVLLALEKLQRLPQHYFILEVSAELRERQQSFLKETCPHLFSRIQWLDTLPQKMTGIIFANEVMDAMPVHCFQIEENIQEKKVAWENNHFAWELAPATDELEQAVQIINADQRLPVGYASEINLMMPAWIRALGDALEQGLILLCDYGYGRDEYYHADRQQGTLMCFYQHHRHDDAFALVGLQDITTHVDFTQVAESALEAGMGLAGFTTQTGFLLACGLLELANEAELSAAELYQQNQAIKKLTLPSQMGELVKVMGLKKNLALDWLGFGLQDRRRGL